MPETHPRRPKIVHWRLLPLTGLLALSLTACPALNGLPGPQGSGNKPGSSTTGSNQSRSIKLTPSQVAVELAITDLELELGLTTVAPDAPFRVAASVPKRKLVEVEVKDDQIDRIRAIPLTGGDPYVPDSGLVLKLEVNKVYRLEVTLKAESGSKPRVLTTLYKVPLEDKGKQGRKYADVSPTTTLADAAVSRARESKLKSLDLGAFLNVVKKVADLIDAFKSDSEFGSAIQYADLTQQAGLDEVLREASRASAVSGSPGILENFQDSVQEAARKDDATNNTDPVGQDVEVPESQGETPDPDSNRGAVEDAVKDDQSPVLPDVPTPEPSVSALQPFTDPSSGGSNGGAQPGTEAPSPTPANALRLKLDPGILYTPPRDPSWAKIQVFRGGELLDERIKFYVYSSDGQITTDIVAFGRELHVQEGAAPGSYWLEARHFRPDGSVERPVLRFEVRSEDGTPVASPSPDRPEPSPSPGRPSPVPSPSPSPAEPTPSPTLREPWSGSLIIQDPPTVAPFPDRQPWTGTVIIGDEPEVTK